MKTPVYLWRRTFAARCGCGTRCVCPVLIRDRTRRIVDTHVHLVPPKTCLRRLPTEVCLGRNLWNLRLMIFRFLSIATTLLIVSQFVTHPPGIGAVHLKACGTGLQEQQNAVWNATHPTEPPPPLLLSYEQCLVECGTGMGDVNWQSFSGDFGAWLLPWIALMFQIPFGAERKFYYSTFASRSTI